MAVKEKLLTRNDEITRDYLAFLDQHIADLLAGSETEMLHINEIAQRLFISPGHLTNTLKLATGHHPCYYFDLKIIEEANKLLLDTKLSASEIARRLSFDPSNFVKFYRSLTGVTPTAFRSAKVLPDNMPILEKVYAQVTEG
jgi:AraC family transcriptional regulator of adaptative response / methylphosphotriester-DNA alkyltransferase methyltransferase